MNKTQAYRALCNGQDVQLKMQYWERVSYILFQASFYGVPERETAFKHKLECEKRDFIGMSTFYGGNKSDCKFKFSVYVGH